MQTHLLGDTRPYQNQVAKPWITREPIRNIQADAWLHHHLQDSRTFEPEPKRGYEGIERDLIS